MRNIFKTASARIFSPRLRKTMSDYPLAENRGFSLLELMIAMTITLVLLGVISTGFAGALRVRERETSRSDALTAAQAAINVMSREISNSGFGLKNNGIVLADSGAQKLHFRCNVKNNNLTTTDAEEDVTYYYDATSKSIVRYDANTGIASAVINQVSEVNFSYFDFTDANSNPTNGTTTPTLNTGRVEIKLIVYLTDVYGQPKNQTVTFRSQVTLRNSTYMLNQY